MTSRPRIWSIGSVVIILLLAYAGWMLLLRPAFAHVATTRQEVVSTWTQVDRARAKTQDLARQKEDLQSQVDELLRLRAKIPKDVNVPTLMRTIQADAKSEGVVLDTLQPGEITLFPVVEPSATPSPEQSAAAAGTPAPKAQPTPEDLGQGLAPQDAGLAYVPLSLSGQGDYVAIRDFITRVEHQQRAFLVTVLNVVRQTGGDTKQPLEFTLEARVFVLNAKEVRLPASLQSEGQ